MMLGYCRYIDIRPMSMFLNQMCLSIRVAKRPVNPCMSSVNSIHMTGEADVNQF